MGPTVRTTASISNRSLVKAATARRRIIVRVELLFWRRMIDAAVAEAKKTEAGLLTDAAILARYWLEEFRPPQADRVEWECSFECCCSWLNIDPKVERIRLAEEIDKALDKAWRIHVRSNTYLRRASVLTCAGIPTAIGKSLVLPLVSCTDYDSVAGIDHPDPKLVESQLARIDQGRAEATALMVL